MIAVHVLWNRPLEFMAPVQTLALAHQLPGSGTGLLSVWQGQAFTSQELQAAITCSLGCAADRERESLNDAVSQLGLSDVDLTAITTLEKEVCHQA